jgi:uncharacterized phage infection (PIP) family protein YhgE
MKQNIISTTLADPDKTAIITAIDDIEAKMRFMINLTPEERKRLRKMGSKSVDYVQQCHKGAINFPNIFPAIVNVGEFTKDMDLIATLQDIKQRLQSVEEAIDDTIMAAGSDAMKSADEVYRYLKQAAEGDAAITELVNDISKRFDGQGNFAQPDNETPPEEPPIV